MPRLSTPLTAPPSISWRRNEPVAEIVPAIARVAGVQPPHFKLPRFAASLFGKWGDFVERRGKEPIVNTTQIRYAFTNRFRFKSEKAARELGYTISPLEPAIRDAITWFRANGML